MTHKRRFFYFLFLIIIVLLLFFYFYVISKKNNNNNIPNGIYFINTDAYLGYFQDEDVLIQIPVIVVHQDESIDINSFYNSIKLISSDKSEIPVASYSFLLSQKEKEYSLYTAEFKINNLKPGVYEITQVEVSNNSTDEYFSVGTINLEMRTGNNSTDLSRNRTTIGMNIFSHYTTELTNNSNNDISIGSLDIGNISNRYNVDLIVGADYDMNTDNITISKVVGKDDIIGLNFNFEAIDPHIDMLKPLLTYSKNSEKCIMSLPLAIYWPSLSEEQVWLILKNITQKN